MRTTLTLDDDVAALVAELRRRRKSGLRQIVNEALRRGLLVLQEPPDKHKPFRTRTVSLGGCLVGSLDDTTEALAVAEGETFR